LIFLFGKSLDGWIRSGCFHESYGMDVSFNTYSSK